MLAIENSMRDVINFPTELLYLHPYELKTYLCLKVAIANSPSGYLPSLRSIATNCQDISWDVLRLTILILRLQGLLLLRSRGLVAVELLNEIEDMPFELLDRPLDTSEILYRDVGFYDFVQSCLSLDIRQWVFATGSTPESRDVYQRMQDCALALLKIRRRVESYIEK